MSARPPLLCGAGLVALLSFSGAVSAGIPIEFPAAESAEDWAPALALGDFEFGPATGESWVKVETADPQWVLRVRDRSGQVHRVLIDAPQTSADREALVLLAASLIEPSTSRQLPGLKRPEPVSLPAPISSSTPSLESETSPSTEDQPAEVDISPQPTIAVAQPLEPSPGMSPVLEPLVEDRSPRDPMPSSLAETLPVERPEPAPSSIEESGGEALERPSAAYWSVRSGAGAIVREGLELAPLVELGLSWELPRVHLAGLARGVPSSGLDLVEGSRSVASGELWTEATTSLSRLHLGLGLGLRALRFEDPPADTESWVLEPSSALVMGLQLFETSRLRLGVDASLGVDLGRIQLRIDDVDQAEFPRTSLCVKGTVQRRVN